MQSVVTFKNKKNRKRRTAHRAMGILLSVALAFHMLSADGFAVYASEEKAGLCEHHPEHTPDCGYAEAEPGAECTHEHGADCYKTAENCIHEHRPSCYPEDITSEEEESSSDVQEKQPTKCSHSCSEDSGCVTRELDCRHEHDESCGFREETPGSPCTFVCGICGSKTPEDDGKETDSGTETTGTKSEDNTEEPDDGQTEKPGNGQEKCICEEPCKEDNGNNGSRVNRACPVCGADGSDLSACQGKAAEDNKEQPEDTGICRHHRAHDGDCGYQSASEDGEGSPCTYDCRICPIEKLIAALPEAEDITEDNVDEVRAQLEEILVLFSELAEDEQEQLDISRCLQLQKALDAANTPVPVADPVVSVTIDGMTTEYSDVAAAWSAAKGADSPVIITLLDDATTGELLTVGEGCDITFTSTKDSNTLLYTGIWSVFEVKGGRLVIKNGTFEATNGDIGHCCVNVKSGEAVIEGGTYLATKMSTSTLLISGGELHISGGLFEATASGASKGIMVNGGEVNISGGIFRAKQEGCGGLYIWQGGTVNISGGLFEGGEYGIGFQTGTVTLSGGTFIGGKKMALGEYSGSTYTLYGLLKDYGNDSAQVHYAYFDQDDNPVTEGLDKSRITGTVTIKACEHKGENVCEYTQLQGDQHQAACLACGYTESAEDCKYQNYTEIDGENHRAICVCGAEKTLPHIWFQSVGEGDKSKEISRSCLDCPRTERVGTIAITDDFSVPYGQTAGRTLEVTKDPEDLAVVERIVWYREDVSGPLTSSTGDTPVYSLPEELSADTYRYNAMVWIGWGYVDLWAMVTVTPAQLTDEMVTLSTKSVVYNGTEQKPAVTVRHGDKELKEGTDYEISYSSQNFTDAGEIRITVTGKGNYEGVVEKTYTIQKADVTQGDLTYTPPTDLFYDGQPKMAAVTVKLQGITVTVMYKDEKGNLTEAAAEPGTYEVYAQVEGGNYNSGAVKVGAFSITHINAPSQILYNGEGKCAYYNGKVEISADGYTVSDAADGVYADSFPITAKPGEAGKTLYFKDGSGHITKGVQVTVWFDLTPPTGRISVGAKWWADVLHFVSFGHYKAKDYVVSIEAEDEGGSQPGGIWYAVAAGEEQYTEAGALTAAVQAGKVSWLPYDAGKKPTVSASGGKYVVYAKLTDNVGNVTYISTDGILLDRTPPTVGSLTVAEDTVTDHTATFTFTIDEAGEYYYAVLDQGAAEPSAKDVIATCDPQAQAGAGGAVLMGCVLTGSGVVSEKQTESGATAITVNAEGLTPGAGYRVYVTAVDRTVDITDSATGSFAGNIAAVAGAGFTMKKTPQAAPELVYQIDRTDTADIQITIQALAGAEYSFDGGKTWTDDNVKGGFDLSQTADLAIRLKETATHDQSPMQTVTIDLAKKDREAPPAFTLLAAANGETDYTVTIPPTEGCEYSFDGKTWSGTNVKAGVRPGETVTGYKRYQENNDYNASSAVSDSRRMMKFTVKTPVISPAGGSYSGSVSVTITCASPDAEIYYTTDGSTPGRSSIRYTGAFSVTAPAIIKAMAVKEGLTDSAVASETYTKKSDSNSDAADGNGGGNSDKDNAGTSGGNPGEGYGGGSGSKRPDGEGAAPQIPMLPPTDTNTDPGSGNIPTRPKTGTGNPVRPKAAPDNDAGAPTQGTKQPFIKDANGKIGWDVIRAEEEKAEEGSTINVDMNGSTVVPGDIFDCIRDRDITVTFDMGNGIIWSVDGKSIIREPSLEKEWAIDFSVKTGTDTIPVDLVNNVTGDRYSIQLSLAHEGEFGFTAILSIQLGKENAGLTASLYHYEENTGELALICKDEVAEDGTAKLVFTHASDYVIVIDGEREEKEGAAEPVQDKETDGAAGDKMAEGEALQTGQTQKPWQFVLLSVLMIVIGTGIFFVRRKKESDD